MLFRIEICMLVSDLNNDYELYDTENMDLFGDT